MSDRSAKIALRNARIRAWRAHGMPVTGGWGEISTPTGKPQARFGIRCSGCDYDVNLSYFLDDGEFEEHESDAMTLWRDPCPHLAPLLGEDPRGVVELTALELLADE